VKIGCRLHYLFYEFHVLPRRRRRRRRQGGGGGGKEEEEEEEEEVGVRRRSRQVTLDFSHLSFGTV